VEERGRSGDDDDADEGQECRELLLPGEGLARDEPGADVAGENGGEEGEHGCFGEGHVEEGEVKPEDTEKAKETTSDEE
jgi:hypothetical protein